MERAVPGRIYEFDSIPIEVRADDDPFTVISKEGGIGNGVDLSYFRWLSLVFFTFTLMAGVVFTCSVLYI